MILAASPPADQVVTGVLAFLIVAGMSLALFFLLRSMNKHLRKVASGPRWQREAGRPGPSGQPADPPAAAGPSEPDQDFQQNGTRLS